MIEIVASFNDNVNTDLIGQIHILIKGETWMELDTLQQKN
jgi:hypothetical protein